ncbi:hypothetical protein BGZ46_010888 [Entomortierella lignicola]|nr:hypothetical protein BGZ46_010888 [Entomortierella lignicola]
MHSDLENNDSNPQHSTLEDVTTDEEDCQAEPIWSSQPPFRAFRPNTEQESELLTALEIYHPFTAPYGDKETTWGKIFDYLKLQDQIRESKGLPSRYLNLKAETCRRRWRALRGLWEQHSKYLEEASGVSPLPSREMDRIEALYEEESAGRDQAQRAKVDKHNKRQLMQENQISGTWLRDQAILGQPRKRIRINKPTSVPTPSSPDLPSSSLIAPSVPPPTPSTAATSPRPLTNSGSGTWRPSVVDIQVLVDRADQESALFREQRATLFDMKDIIEKDIEERRNERAEQKQSTEALLSIFKEQQTTIARQQDLMFQMMQRMQESYSK